MTAPWKLLDGTTYENACDTFAMWTRDHGDYAEALYLPGYIIKNLGHIPAPQIAWLIIEMKREAERL